MLLRRAFRLANAGGALRITEKAIARLLAEVGSHATAPAGQDLLRACFQLADGERAGGENSHKHGRKRIFFSMISPFSVPSICPCRCRAFGLADARWSSAWAKTTTAWTLTDVAGHA
jgi:hypothetical protein